MPPHAPAHAPNVLLIMTDDVGFGASSTFGGPVPTPTFDALARQGIRYNAFHTTAMCSPTRAALLTGRNHHQVGFGVVAELATDAPGYDASIEPRDATIAQVLRMNGYNTAMFGKNHNTPMWERTPLGPFNRWPTGLGFDYFYGFNGGWASQFAPELVENTTAIDPPRGQPGYTLESDLADHAITWLHNQRNLQPNSPFFLYYAPATSHAPHQAPAEWIAKFDGQFTQGWDRLREESFARQKRMGVVPANAQLTPRPAQIPAWDSLSTDEKRAAVREMQVYAAALSYADAQIGRVIEDLRASGQLDNTLVIFIQGDNGASAEDAEGTIDIYSSLADRDGTYAETLPRIAELGSATTMPNYPVGWAWATNAPFQWSKLVASHFGGTRNGMVVSWPGHMVRPETVRGQFAHVIDVAPTIYEAAGITPPQIVSGVTQEPLQGTSMLYSFTDPAAPSRHRTQYFELMGSRAFYSDGWIASTTPANMPWVRAGRRTPAEQFQWELYDLTHDYAQANNVAARYPAKLDELRKAFDVAAAANHVRPLDVRTSARLRPGLAPSLTAGRNHFEYLPSHQRYEMGMVPDMTGNWRITAQINTPDAHTSGMIAVRGNLHNGWGLFQQDGVPRFVFRISNNPGDVVSVAGTDRLAPGPHRVEVLATHDTPSPFSAGTLTLRVDGQPAGSARVPRFGFSYGLLFVGREGYEPLIEGQSLPAQYQGQIAKVEIDLLP